MIANFLLRTKQKLLKHLGFVLFEAFIKFDGTKSNEKIYRHSTVFTIQPTDVKIETLENSAAMWLKK